MKQTSLLTKVCILMTAFFTANAVHSTYHYWQFKNASSGLDLYNAGRYREAIPHLYALREMMPNTPGVGAELAACLVEEKDYPSAVSAYQRLIKAGAADYDDYYSYGYCLASQGQHQAAIDAWQESLRSANKAYASEATEKMPGYTIRLARIRSTRKCLYHNLGMQKPS